MHFFNFGQITPKENENEILSCCKYQLDSNNFIVTLLKDRTCNCACFATYVKSVAEEFGYGDYIRFCMQPEHVSIVVVDPDSKQYSTLSLEMANAWNHIQDIFHLTNIHIYHEGDQIQKPLVGSCKN
jgi:hypothetical protein